MTCEFNIHCGVFVRNVSLTLFFTWLQLDLVYIIGWQDCRSEMAYSMSSRPFNPTLMGLTVTVQFLFRTQNYSDVNDYIVRTYYEAQPLRFPGHQISWMSE